MLGILVYRLRTVRGGHYSMFPGKMLHGAFFHHLAAYDSALATEFHECSVKPFTIGCLHRAGAQGGAVPHAQEMNELHCSVGDELLLRVTALNERALAAFLYIRAGATLEVGRLAFVVEEVLADGRADTGIVRIDELIGSSLSVDGCRKIRFHFRAPTVFRVDGRDHALPDPALIFASLSDKWMQMGMPAEIDKSRMREIAVRLMPLEWRGAGIWIRQSAHKTIPAFMGSFAFSPTFLSAEEQESIILLTCFAPFCGMGRMTAQGMGETHIELL